MRIKKRHIREKVDPRAVANQAKEVIGAVQDELDSDEDTAKSFVKAMTVSENEEENNPWAICTASVGRDDKEKYEACVKKVKAQYNIDETLTEDEFGASNRAIQHGVKPEPKVSDADKRALKIGEPKKKINYGEKDLPFESEIRENKSSRKVIKTIKVKDLK